MSFIWDGTILKEMVSFTGWNLIGSGSALIMSQGYSILLNQFFGPVVNAAKGISNQVLGMIGKFSGNFQMALNPQIFKSYASENLDYMYKLIFASSKYSYYMLFVLSLPIAIESKTLLRVWLDDVPDNTNEFLRLILLTAAVNVLANPLVISAQATGKIKKIQMAESVVLLLILPFTYFSFKIGALPVIGFYIYFLFHVIAVIVRLMILQSLIKISYKDYFVQVISPILSVTFLSIALGGIAFYYLDNETFFNSLVVCFLVCLFTIGIIFLFGLNRKEKDFVCDKLKTILRKVSNRV